MPNIKPVSDLRNYAELLRGVDDGSPVCLTVDGRGQYVLTNLTAYEKTLSMHKLMNELEKGRRSGEEKGWLTAEEVRTHFRGKSV